MIKKQSKIQDLLLLYPESFKDSRGEYFQTFNIDEYDFVLVNYNDSYYGNPYPMLYFVNKEHYYKYDIFRSKTYNKMPFKKSQFPIRHSPIFKGQFSNFVKPFFFFFIR